jgi:predicted permease
MKLSAPDVARGLRHHLRALARNPGFTAAAVLSLALGIGMNTAIFSVTSGLLLHPLPYRDADRLVILWNRSPGLNITQDWFSTAQYFDIRNHHRGFEQLAIAIGANYNLTGAGDPERVGVIRVSSNLLTMLGSSAARGRLFVAEEDAPGGPATAVLSYGAWTRRFGGDPGVIGRNIILNGLPYQVAGVLPASFSLPREVLPTLGLAENGEIFLSLPLAADASTVRTREDYNIIGRLKRGVSVAQAQSEMNALTARLRQDYPQVYPPNGGLTFGIVPLLEQVVGEVRRPLLILLASVGVVLLIACANVANLLLSRMLSRRREIAVRTALGASRAQILGQLLAESLLLALLGGGLGVLLAAAGVRWIHVLQPKDIPRLPDIAVDGRVLLFTLLLCALSAVICGLAPALRIGRIDLHEDLKDAARGSAGEGSLWGHGNHLRRLLVIGQLALSMVLLIGAGLLIRSFARIEQVSPGFSTANVLSFELTMTGRKYADAPTLINGYKHLWGRLDALPGVSASGGVSSLPFSQYFSWGPITVEGRVPPAGENFLNADVRVASSRYFETVQIPVLRGRFFNDQDTAANPRVTLVDDYMAEQLWPGEDAIGKRIRLGDSGSNPPWTTVVGVVGRVKQYALDADSRIALYVPHTQLPARAMYVVLRSGSDAGVLAAAVRREIRDLDPDLPVYHVRTVKQLVDESLAHRRFSMLLLGLFAALALVLATIGIYGVMAYLVTQGAREIGIRMALGATESRIVRLVVGRGVAIGLAGVGVGLAGAFALTRFLQSLLFGVPATDAATFIAVALLLAAIAVLASLIPAWRAARIDPMTSLRSE